MPQQPAMLLQEETTAAAALSGVHGQGLSTRTVPVPNGTTSEAIPGHTWYLPHFGEYHPKRPNQVRTVFNSSVEYQGASLNKILLTGPDQMNSLHGVLLRFRLENTAVMCGMEPMFHVNQEHRDFLRFLWFRNKSQGDPSLPGDGPPPQEWCQPCLGDLWV